MIFWTKKSKKKVKQQEEAERQADALKNELKLRREKLLQAVLDLTKKEQQGG